jgi:hypothetical protein
LFLAHNRQWILRFAANGVAEVELGRDGRRGKVLCLAVKYWLRTLQMDKEEPVRVCYEWQVNNLEFDSWARKLSEHLSKIGLGYIWQDLRVNTVSGICKKIKQRYNDIERQNLFANIKEKRSLILYSEMGQEWTREEYIVCCTRKERSELAWFKTGIWKPRVMRKGLEKGRCPLCSENEDAVHLLLKCSETRKWRKQFLSMKWLRLNEWIVFKKIQNCTNITELRNTGSFLYKIKCKWENKIRNLSSELGSSVVVIR